MSTWDLDRLQTLLDVYGADPQRWPAHERDAAWQLVQQSSAAQALHRQALALDAMLDADRVPPPDAALRTRILSTLPAPRADWRRWLADLWAEIGGWRLAAPAFALSLSLGMWLPTLLTDSDSDLPDEDLIAAVQLIDDMPELGP
jgi:hypothetical protein